VIHSVDLTSFTSGNSNNANGSGFTLSLPISIKFSEGSDLDVYKYRTGSWTIDASDQRSGWNYMRVRHTVGGVTRNTNYFEWVNDNATAASSFENAALTNLALSGLRQLSGVSYYTEGQAAYSVKIKNAYMNSFSASLSAISHPTTKNCSTLSESLPVTSSHLADVEIEGKPVLLVADENGRILGDDVEISTQVLRTVQSSVTSATVTGGWKILLDASEPEATEMLEDFSTETYRRSSSVDLSDTTYGLQGVGPGTWDSAATLSDGLLVYGGTLRYPTNTFSGGDFRLVDEGNTSGLTSPGGPSGNPDYSSTTGEKVYLRYFYLDDATQNFILSVTSEDTDYVSSDQRGSLSGNQVSIEIAAPNTTRDEAGLLAWKDCVTPYTHDAGVGAYATTFGDTIPTSWGVTLGTKSTATSGYAVLLRITAPDTWAGSISGITLTPL
jgi:hypothetical protein